MGDCIYAYMQLDIIKMYRQIANFEQYQERVSSLIGPQQAKKLVNDGIVLITLGGNDFINNYYLTPYTVRSLQYSLPDYVQYVISEYKKILRVKLLYNLFYSIELYMFSTL